MKKVKEWLKKCNEEGISNGDAIFMGVGITVGTLLPFILYKIFG